MKKKASRNICVLFVVDLDHGTHFPNILSACSDSLGSSFTFKTVTRFPSIFLTGGRASESSKSYFLLRTLAALVFKSVRSSVVTTSSRSVAAILWWRTNYRSGNGARRESLRRMGGRNEQDSNLGLDSDWRSCTKCVTTELKGNGQEGVIES